MHEGYQSKYFTRGYGGYDDSVNNYDEVSEFQQKVSHGDHRDYFQLLENDASSLDWNERFQRILELPEVDNQSSLDKYHRLTQLTNDFVDASKTFGRVIISEAFVPDPLKTIKRSGVGGVAGGDKYVVGSILFKFAVDPPIKGETFLYGGNERNDELSAKGAGHDLRGAVQYLGFSLSLAGPTKALDRLVARLPMQCLIDYQGFRLMAMPVLPLDPSRPLLYGSSNAGKVVANEDPHGFMLLSSRELHLAPHFVGSKLMLSAGDVELHLGLDGRYYLLDFGRAMPPEDPRSTPHLPFSPQSIFYRLLRPEYQLIRRENGLPPLSSDSLSGWSKHQPDAVQHNAETVRATIFLMQDIIPAFARKLIAANRFRLGELLEPVGEKLHTEGIGLRHLGLLRSLVPTEHVRIRSIFLVEMVQRTLKNVLRGWLRKAQSLQEQQAPYMLKSLVAQAFNLFLGSFYDASSSSLPSSSNFVAASSSSAFVIPVVSTFPSDHLASPSPCSSPASTSLLTVPPSSSTIHSTSLKFWENEIIAGLVGRFGACALLPIETAESVFNMLKADEKLQGCINFAAKRVGYRVTVDVHASQRSLFQHQDLESAPHAKYMSIADYAAGKYTFMTAERLYPIDKNTAHHLRRIAFDHFRAGLASNPLHYGSVVECCQSWAWSNEVEKKFSRADEIVLDRITARPFALPFVAAPLLRWLLQTWDSRLAKAQLGDWEAPELLFAGFGGASSIKPLVRMSQLLHVHAMKERDKGEKEESKSNESQVLKNSLPPSCLSCSQPSSSASTVTSCSSDPCSSTFPTPDSLLDSHISSVSSLSLSLPPKRHKWKFKPDQNWRVGDTLEGKVAGWAEEASERLEALLRHRRECAEWVLEAHLQIFGPIPEDQQQCLIPGHHLFQLSPPLWLKAFRPRYRTWNQDGGQISPCDDGFGEETQQQDSVQSGSELEPTNLVHADKGLANNSHSGDLKTGVQRTQRWQQALLIRVLSLAGVGGVGLLCELYGPKFISTALKTLHDR